MKRLQFRSDEHIEYRRKQYRELLNKNPELMQRKKNHLLKRVRGIVK